MYLEISRNPVKSEAGSRWRLEVAVREGWAGVNSSLGRVILYFLGCFGLAGGLEDVCDSLDALAGRDFVQIAYGGDFFKMNKV